MLTLAPSLDNLGMRRTWCQHNLVREQMGHPVSVWWRRYEVHEVHFRVLRGLTSKKHLIVVLNMPSLRRLMLGSLLRLMLGPPQRLPANYHSSSMPHSCKRCFLVGVLLSTLLVICYFPLLHHGSTKREFITWPLWRNLRSSFYSNNIYIEAWHSSAMSRNPISYYRSSSGNIVTLKLLRLTPMKVF